MKTQYSLQDVKQIKEILYQIISDMAVQKNDSGIQIFYDLHRKTIQVIKDMSPKKSKVGVEKYKHPDNKDN